LSTGSYKEDKVGEIFSLSREITLWPNQEFNIFFKEDCSLYVIQFGNKIIQRKKHWYSRKSDSENISLISAISSDDFSKKYLGLVLPDLRSKGDSDCTKIPSILNGVPDEIRMMYGAREQDSIDALRKLKTNNGNLSSLDVSDFK